MTGSKQLRQLTQVDGFIVTGRGPIVICAESYYDFDPPIGLSDHVMIDGCEAIVKGIEASMTNPLNYGKRLAIVVAWVDRHHTCKTQFDERCWCETDLEYDRRTLNK